MMWQNFLRHKNCLKRYNSDFVCIFAIGMYSLKEAWIKMHGAEPVEDWDGKMYCCGTDSDTTIRANETHGYVAAYSFTLVVCGQLTLFYNGQEIVLHPDDLYIYSPGMPVTIVSSSSDYRGICLLADEHETLDIPSVHDLVHIAYMPLVQLHQPRLALPHPVACRISDRMRDIISYQHSAHTYKAEILRMLYGIFLLELRSAIDSTSQQRAVSQRVEDIFTSFMRLLPEYFVEHRDIAFYAGALNISPVYLSRIVRQTTGRTVRDYINQLLLMESVFLLRTTHLSVAQVADRLHFADSASFVKFFLRMKGLTPRSFREQNLS